VGKGSESHCDLKTIQGGGSKQRLPDFHMRSGKSGKAKKAGIGRGRSLGGSRELKKRKSIAKVIERPVRVSRRNQVNKQGIKNLMRRYAQSKQESAIKAHLGVSQRKSKKTLSLLPPESLLEEGN